MSATVTAHPNGRTEQGSAFHPDDIGGARLVFVNMRVGSILVRYARQRVVTRVFGIPEENQSLLVTITLLGTAATVVGGVVVRLLPRPSGTDLAMGSAVFNTGLRGLAGPPAGHIPLAGALIAGAVLVHSLRPAAAESVREIRRLAHGSRAMVGRVRSFLH